MLGAGLKGIEDELPLAPEATNNIFKMTESELSARVSPRCRGTRAAIELFAGSKLMEEVLGSHIHSFYAENKRGRVDEYRNASHAVGARPLPVHHLRTSAGTASQRDELTGGVGRGHTSSRRRCSFPAQADETVSSCI